MAEKKTSSLGAVEQDFWQLLFARRWLVLFITSGFAVLAAVAAFVVQPIYRATAVLLPADTGDSSSGLGSMLGDLSGLASVAGLNLNAGDNSIEAVALLQSRQFTEAFIKDEKLLPKLFQNRLSADGKTWKESFFSSAPELYDGYQVFSQEVRRVTQDKKTGIVTVDVDWPNADEGARWANTLVSRVNESMRNRAIAEADASIELLTIELQQSPTTELQQAIARTIESQVKRRSLARVRKDYAFRIIDPAMPPSRNDFIQPNRFLYVLGGLVGGFLLSGLLVYALEKISELRKRK